MKIQNYSLRRIVHCLRFRERYKLCTGSITYHVSKLPNAKWYRMLYPSYWWVEILMVSIVNGHQMPRFEQKFIFIFFVQFEWLLFFFHFVCETETRTLRGCVDEMDESLVDRCRSDLNCEICHSLGGAYGCNANVSINTISHTSFSNSHYFTFEFRSFHVIVSLVINAPEIWTPIAALRQQIQMHVAYMTNLIVVISEKQVNFSISFSFRWIWVWLTQLHLHFSNRK